MDNQFHNCDVTKLINDIDITDNGFLLRQNVKKVIVCNF